MWTREMLGTDVYHLAASFMIYSIMGWFVESVYMSVCNHKITNRGFGKGPFCPIYGFGAVIGYLVLSPLKQNLVELYFVGAILATIFEFMVAKLMKKVLGEVWWDYNEKPFNYQGIICLESTIAWGFYGIIIVMFLQQRVYRFIDSYSAGMVIRFILVCMSVVLIDYMIQLYKIFGETMKQQKNRMVEKYRSFKARWY